MKHYFELPGGQYDDKIVIIDYHTSSIITPEFQDLYNRAAGHKFAMESELDAALEKLIEHQNTPEPLQDPETLNKLASEHKLAVCNYEQAVKRVDDLDKRAVPQRLIENSVQVHIVDLYGNASSVTKLSFQALQAINNEIDKLKETAGCNKKSFRDALQNTAPGLPI